MSFIILPASRSLPRAVLNDAQHLSRSAIRSECRFNGILTSLNRRHLFTRSGKPPRSKMATIGRGLGIGLTSVVFGTSFLYILYHNDQLQPLPATKPQSQLRVERENYETKVKETLKSKQLLSELPYQQHRQATAALADDSAWGSFTSKFALFSSAADLEWGVMTESIRDFILPDWAKLLPDYINKLQKELSMAPGSLADDIWQEAQDPSINPEIEYSATVRVSSDLCDEEKEFLRNRKKHTAVALAKYLGIPQEDVNPEDVPTIALVGSGGGLRALVAGAGSILAAGDDGLFDCVTYSAGVSGSCWLQALFNSSLGGRRPDRLVDHLKARLGVHIAYPPVALAALNSAPTNKFLLSGFVEKLKGDPESDLGLVDAYGLLLAARLLVPKGEIGVDDRDLKISNQREYIKHGEHPMPIYTAVRHEIPILDQASDLEKATNSPSEETKKKAKDEAYFQWLEISPYELFVEEFGAGIPTWALGRKFENGKDLPFDESGLRVPELRLPLLLGIFGSAFCATLSHYYREVRPLMKGLAGFGGIDEMIEGRNNDMSKVHPIDPASLPNFAYKMDGKLPETCPESVYKSTHLRLMDAGMSNNLPIYPLLRPGRDVDILVAFDASADVKTDNWLSVADGYAKQRGIKGWPVGIGWPKETDTAEKAASQLEEASASTAAERDLKLEDAKRDQVEHLKDVEQKGSKAANSIDPEDSGDLGYCTVWVGTTEERTSGTDDVKSKAVKEDWELMQPDAGIAVVYFPFMKNPKVPGVDPKISEYMSTWNFVYAPEDIDSVVALARANFDEGREQMRRCVRAVYERKKKKREEREHIERQRIWRMKVRQGAVGRKGNFDHFHLT